MAYFDCIVGGSGKGNTLVVTCADDLAGATITCTNGTKTYNKTCPSTSPYEVTFYGLEAGTWTVSATVSGNTYTATVVITDYEAELGGFSWRRWVDTASQLDSTDYASLSEVLADEEAVRELCLEHACVDYMASITATNADVETIINTDLFAKWVNNSDYSLDTLGANTIIKALMDEADKYGYGEWTLQPQVPKMTSNTAPYGVASASSVYTSDYAAWKAFDGNDSSFWHSVASTSSTAEEWIEYDFISPVHIGQAYVKNDANRPYNTVDILGYDGTQWVSIGTSTDTSTRPNTRIVDCNSSVAYSKIRAKFSGLQLYSGSYAIALTSLQFCAWAPKGNVPVMTSNTAPYGKASGTNVASNSDYYKAFNGDDAGTPVLLMSGYTGTLVYEFTNPVKAKKCRIHWQSTTSNQFILSVSNDGISYTNLGTYTKTETSVTDIIALDTDNYYKYYKITETAGGSGFYIFSLQFYGRELSVSVPVMTANNAPYGEVTVSSYYPQSQFQGFHAFDATESGWNPANSDEYNSANLVYKFTTDIVPVMFGASGGKNGSDTDLTTIKFLVSKDGITYTDTNKTVAINKYSATRVYDTLNLSDSYKYCKFLVTQGVSIASAWGFKFFIYGKDYSEKEFEEGVTKKWLYDHGVELEELVASTSYSGHTIGTYTKNNNNIQMNVSGSSNDIALSVQLDCTPYNYLMCKGRKLTNNANQYRLSTSSTAYLRQGNIGYYEIQYTVPKNSINAVDVSSLSQQAYCGVYLETSNTANATSAMFTELWLE